MPAVGWIGLREIVATSDTDERRVGDPVRMRVGDAMVGIGTHGPPRNRHCRGRTA